MVRVKYLFLGAGPSGLAAATALRESGETSLLVLEKEDECGGLCRSAIVDGAPLDRGGGHFLDVSNPAVLDFLFHFMPKEEWNEFERDSRIHIYGDYVPYPLEANLWRLAPKVVTDILESIARAGCVQGTAMPASFEDWIVWKLGARIAEDYMLPYNRKIWPVDLNQLGTYWLYKLPDVSFRDTLYSCITRRPAGTLPCHAAFLYPKRYGYGEVWKRIGAGLGQALELCYRITRVDLDRRRVNDEIEYDYIINTIPWSVWPDVARIPGDVCDAMQSLVAGAIDLTYSPEPPPNGAHWIYEPAEQIAYHRILCRANFVPGSRGMWTETNAKRTPRGVRPDFRNPFAYPVNTRSKPNDLATIRAWAESNRIVPLGRWGTWEHMNSDVAVTLALKAARALAK